MKQAAPTVQTAFRLPVELVERLDAYAEHMREKNPGLLLSRADVVRNLLYQALDLVDHEKWRQK